MAAANGVRGRAPGLVCASMAGPPNVSARHGWHGVRRFVQFCGANRKPKSARITKRSRAWRRLDSLSLAWRLNP